MSELDPTPELPDNMPIREVRFPTQIKDALRAAGLKTVGQVRTISDEALFALPDFGTASVTHLRHTLGQSWLRKSEQSDKWSFCLTAGKIGPRIRRDDEQTSTPEPHTGFQGEGGACRGQGRSNTGSIGGAVRR